jgi:hypothetical protein
MVAGYNPMTMHVAIIANIIGGKVVGANVIKEFETRDAALIGLGEIAQTLVNMKFKDVTCTSQHCPLHRSYRHLAKDNWPYLVCASVEETLLIMNMVARPDCLVDSN